MVECTIQASVSGRYLLRPSLQPASPALLAGFHGYGQTAEEELRLLASLPGSERFTLCSVEALHPFYIRKGVVGASWMTISQREMRIEENVRYVDAVIDRVLQPRSLLVFHGFSQGVGMASRAVVLGRHVASGLMLLGGEFPPELSHAAHLPPVHIARGDRDPIYTEKHFQQDCDYFAGAGTLPVTCVFRGGHEAGEEYLRSAGEFLYRFLPAYS